MHQTFTENRRLLSITLGGLAIVILGLSVALFLLWKTMHEELATKDATIASANERITELENVLTETQTMLEETVAMRNELSEDLEAEQNRNEEFENQIEKISGTVGTLDKLAKTDEELLMKYSKVYFLNEHYVPEKIVAIEKEHLYDESRDLEIHAKVEPYLTDMIEEAKEDGINLWVVSAYRSFGVQAALKGRYTVTYGSGANAFSADQGYSEHQLGTTVDFTTNDLGGGLDGFGSTPAYEWLTENAYKYGFVLSYPENNAYYVYEPWHWRFVGEDLARDLHRDDAYFYDWDQRKINEYLISIFD